MVDFYTIWTNHPGFADLCDFENQCAIRMGTAFQKAKIDMSSFTGVRCWDEAHKGLNHTLRAQELADWMEQQIGTFGYVSISKDVTFEDYKYKDGLVFFKDGWGATDHIDIWNGMEMKAGQLNYFSRAKEVWFWQLT